MLCNDEIKQKSESKEWSVCVLYQLRTCRDEWMRNGSLWCSIIEKYLAPASTLATRHIQWWQGGWGMTKVPALALAKIGKREPGGCL